jgi:hypothetical protein
LQASVFCGDADVCEGGGGYRTAREMAKISPL